jgi:anti-anti-sigma factor
MAFGECMIAETTFGEAALVRAAGAIDGAGAHAFQSALFAAVESAGTAVIVDMGEAETIGAAALRVLMIAARAARKAGKALAVAAPTPVVREILAISRTDQVVSVYGRVRDALSATAPEGLGAFDLSLQAPS